MSWRTVNLITAATVKEVANLDKNVEDRKLDPAIHDAQNALQQMLGETLYGIIETANPVADPTLGDTGRRTLYDNYIVFYLANKAKEIAMVELWAEASRNGVFQKGGDNYTSVDARGLNAVQSIPRSRAEASAADMLRYIKNLPEDNAIRVAFDTDVKDEPRTKEVKNTGRIITRVSRWQNGGTNYRDDGR